MIKCTSQNCSKLVVKLIAVIAVISICITLRHILPMGWDVFYHLRVLELIGKTGNLINFDPISAGGRSQNYVPGYYSLVSSISQLSDLTNEQVCMFLPLIFMGLSVLAFSRIMKSKWTLVGVALFALNPETLDTFIAAGMPQQLGTFLLLLVLGNSPLNLIYCLTIGISHQSSLVLLIIFEGLRLLVERNREKLLKLTPILLGFIPPIIWFLLVGINTVTPTWGWPVDLDYFLLKFNPLLLLIAGLGLGSLPYTLWSFVFLALSQFNYLPRRFLFPLGISLSFMGVVGTERLPLKNKTKWLFVLGVVLFMSFGALEFGFKAQPVTKIQDVAAAVWAKENLVSGILAHKDLSTIWVLRYAKLPTVLDGYSEGVKNANTRMSDVLKAFESDDLRDATRIASKYKCKYVLYNEIEEWYGARNQKFSVLENLYQNGYAEIRIFS